MSQGSQGCSSLALAVLVLIVRLRREAPGLFTAMRLRGRGVLVLNEGGNRSQGGTPCLGQMQVKVFEVIQGAWWIYIYAPKRGG